MLASNRFPEPMFNWSLRGLKASGMLRAAILGHGEDLVASGYAAHPELGAGIGYLGFIIEKIVSYKVIYEAEA